jgi:hypothetical protein
MINIWLEVLTAVTMRMAVLWVVVLCRLVWVSRRFRGLYCVCHVSNEWSLTNQPTSQPKKQTKGRVRCRCQTPSLATFGHSCIWNALLEMVDVACTHQEHRVPGHPLHAEGSRGSSSGVGPQTWWCAWTAAYWCCWMSCCLRAERQPRQVSLGMVQLPLVGWGPIGSICWSL